MNISNREFLHTIFRADFIWVHVTDFFHDPGKGFTRKAASAWLGNYYVDRQLRDRANQYFAISLFHSINDKARRRKELFKAAYCFVIDDIGEKIPLDKIAQEVAPSWILSTSPNSQQWGYILSAPCTKREKIEALLHGLVNKLCSNNVDPGMLGVTRYVRLPEGYNTKASKMSLNNGPALQMSMVLWNPKQQATIEQYAEAFNIDLTKTTFRIEKTAPDYPDNFFMDHPIWNVITLKEQLSCSKYYVTCPWIDEHTDNADNGTMLFISEYGLLGFKCHHGHCAQRTGIDLIEKINLDFPGWQEEYKSYVANMRKLYEEKIKPCPIKFKSNNLINPLSMGPKG